MLYFKVVKSKSYVWDTILKDSALPLSCQKSKTLLDEICVLIKKKNFVKWMNYRTMNQLCKADQFQKVASAQITVPRYLSAQ